ncbi:MAG: protein translocase subunit SecF [Holosporales bacterium]|jgi:preprotein translocase subunit SecF|nr:protein translocase subunit SecF [Holosporales bacterium]
MIKLIPDNVNINFIGYRQYIFIVSALIIVASVLFACTKGLNYGIDFKGGYVVEARFPEVQDLEVLRQKLSAHYPGDFSLQQVGADGHDVVIKLEMLDADATKEQVSAGAAGNAGAVTDAGAIAGANAGTGTEANAATEAIAGAQTNAQAATNANISNAQQNSTESDATKASHAQVIEKIKSAIGEGVTYRRIETIGPTVGSELVSNAIKAIVFSIIAIAIYIAFRFEWQFAICGLIALAQDCIGLVGAYSIWGMEFNATAIVAILTTASYSINDSIVIFDRIRENIKRYKKMDMPELINRSINETLSRTVLTAGSTLLAVLALCLFGGEVISTFSLPIFIGISLGTFSSIALSAPLLLLFKIDREKIIGAPKVDVQAS